jgi:hypothetical protein
MHVNEPDGAPAASSPEAMHASNAMHTEHEDTHNMDNTHDNMTSQHATEESRVDPPHASVLTVLHPEACPVAPEPPPHLPAESAVSAKPQRTAQHNGHYKEEAEKKKAEQEAKDEEDVSEDNFEAETPAHQLTCSGTSTSSGNMHKRPRVMRITPFLARTPTQGAVRPPRSREASARDLSQVRAAQSPFIRTLANVPRTSTTSVPTTRNARAHDDDQPGPKPKS